MADEDTKKTDEESKEEKKSKAGLKNWIIIGAVVLACAGAGFVLGRMLTGSTVTAAAQASEENAAANDKITNPDDPGAESAETWFRHMDPVVSNLNEPGVTRYIRVLLTLEMTADISKGDAEKLFGEKAPVLTNWLTIYLASLSIEDIRGDKNLRRIQSQILDAYNEQLFPDQKPKIKHILFKEFAIQ